MNYGTIIAWTGAGLNAAASLGYFASGDLRKGLYFAFAFAITATVIWR